MTLKNTGTPVVHGGAPSDYDTYDYVDLAKAFIERTAREGRSFSVPLALYAPARTSWDTGAPWVTT